MEQRAPWNLSSFHKGGERLSHSIPSVTLDSAIGRGSAAQTLSPPWCVAKSAPPLRCHYRSGIGQPDVPNKPCRYDCFYIHFRNFRFLFCILMRGDLLKRKKFDRILKFNIYKDRFFALIEISLHTYNHTKDFVIFYAGSINKFYQSDK